MSLNSLWVAQRSLSQCLTRVLTPRALIPIRNKSEDRKMLAKSTPKRDQGTEGEREIDIDLASRGGIESMFPDADTPNLLFDGVRFDDLPVCNIRATKNNTHIRITDGLGKQWSGLHWTCGREGFKNAKKGTNIAAQATALTLCEKAKLEGVTNVRVCLAGLGPGRASSIKGLQMGGLNIVSITDTTKISWNPPRPRKRRRV